MGLFGDQDAAEVSDNPFFIEGGIYESVFSQFELRVNEKDGIERHALLMQWTIEEEGDYEGQPVSEWVNVYITAEERTSVEKNTLRRDEARAKQRLVAIGMSNEEMNELIDEEGVFNEELAEKYIGTHANVHVKVSQGKGENSDKTYSNIVKVTPVDE